MLSQLGTRYNDCSDDSEELLGNDEPISSFPQVKILGNLILFTFLLSPLFDQCACSRISSAKGLQLALHALCR